MRHPSKYILFFGISTSAPTRVGAEQSRNKRREREVKTSNYHKFQARFGSGGSPPEPLDNEVSVFEYFDFGAVVPDAGYLEVGGADHEIYVICAVVAA